MNNADFFVQKTVLATLLELQNEGTLTREFVNNKANEYLDKLDSQRALFVEQILFIEKFLKENK